MKLFLVQTKNGTKIMTLSKIIRKQKAGVPVRIIKVEREIQK